MDEHRIRVVLSFVGDKTRSVWQAVQKQVQGDLKKLEEANKLAADRQAGLGRAQKLNERVAKDLSKAESDLQRRIERNAELVAQYEKRFEDLAKAKEDNAKLDADQIKLEARRQRELRSSAQSIENLRRRLVELNTEQTRTEAQARANAERRLRTEERLLAAQQRHHDKIEEFDARQRTIDEARSVRSRKLTEDEERLTARREAAIKREEAALETHKQRVIELREAHEEGNAEIEERLQKSRDTQRELNKEGSRWGRLGVAVRAVTRSLNEQTGIFTKVNAAMKSNADRTSIVDDAFRRFAGRVVLMIALLPVYGAALGAVSGVAVSAVGGVAALASAMGALAGAAVILPAALAGVAGAIASIASTAGPALGRIFEAVGEFRQGRRESQIEDPDDGSQRARAEDQVARARVNAAERIADAERALARARRDSAQSVADAERGLQEARRRGTEQLIDAQRRLDDARQQGAREEADSVRERAQLLRDLRDEEADALEALQEAQAAALEDIAKAEDDLADARRDNARRDQDLVEALDEARVDSAQRIADIENDLARARSDFDQDRQDAEEALAESRIDGLERILELERRLAELRDRNARDQRELELALADARASLSAEQLISGGLVNLAGAFVGEAERDLQEFASQAALAEGELQRDIANAHQDRANQITTAEERLQRTLEDGNRRIFDLEQRLAEARIDGPARVADAEEALNEFRTDAAERITDLENALTAARVEGADDVQDAEERLGDARMALREDLAEFDRNAARDEADRIREIGRLREDVDGARADRARDIENAERTLRRAQVEAIEDIADAERALDRARRDAQQAIEDALDSLADAHSRASSALDEAKAKLDALAPAERAVALLLIRLGDLWTRLAEPTAVRVLEGFSTALLRLEPMFVPIIKAMDTFASSVLNLTDNLLDLFEDPIFQANAANATTASVEVFERLGRAGIFLGDAFVTIMSAARPLLTFMSMGLETWARWVSETMRASEESGTLGRFFMATQEVLQVLVSTFGDLFSVLVDIGKIGFPFGVEILRFFEDAAQKARDFTESVEGQKSITDFFRDSTPVFKEFLRVIGAIFATFFNIGRSTMAGGENSPIIEFLRAFRLEFLPWLEGFAIKSFEELGPVLLEFFRSLGGFLSALSGSNGPIAAVIKLFTLFFDIMSLLPPDILASMLAIVAVTKVLGVLVIGFLGFAKSLGLVLVAFQALARLAMAHPWMLAITIAILLLIKYHDELLAAAERVFEVIMAAWDEFVHVVESLAEVFGDAVQAILDFVEDHWKEILVLFTGPFIPLVALFTNAFGLRDAAKRGFEWFTGFFSDLWSSIKDGVTTGWTGITDALKDAWNGITKFFTDIPDQAISGIIGPIWDAVKGGVKAAWNVAGGVADNIGGAIQAGWSGVVGYFTNRPKDAISGIIGPIWDKVGSGVTSAWNFAEGIGSKIAAAWSAIVNWFREVPANTGMQIVRLIESVWEKIWSSVGLAWTAVTNRLRGFVNVLIRGYNWIAGKLPGVPEIDPLDKADPPEAGSTFPRVQGFASGGIVKPVPGGVYRVAEAGQPEGVVPLDPRKRGRAWAVMAEILKHLGPAPGFATGGIAKPVPIKPTMVGGRFGGTHSRGAPPENWQSDNAIDLHVPTGTQLVAIEDGIIGRVTRRPQGGRFGGDEVYLHGRSGRVWWYKHGTRTFVNEGDRVKAGRIIGLSGFANAAHLHLGLGVPDLGPNYSLYPDPGQLLGYTGGTGGILDFLDPRDLLNKAKELLPSLPGVDELTKAGGFAGRILHGLMDRLLSGTLDAITGLAGRVVHGGLGDIVDSVGDFFGLGGDGESAFGELPPEMRFNNRWMNREWGDTPETGRALSRNEAERVLAAALRFTGQYSPENLRRLTELARQESMWRTFAKNTSSAGIAAGGPMGILQVVLGTFLANAHPTMRNPYDPFHNAIASIRYQIGRYREIQENAPYQDGGVVDGRFGQAVGILAHAGEWVLNPQQQQRLARLVGARQDDIRRYLFEGLTLNPSVSAFGAFPTGAPIASSVSNSRVGGTVHQQIFTQQLEVDTDYIMRAAEMRLRTLA